MSLTRFRSSFLVLCALPGPAVWLTAQVAAPDRAAAVESGTATVLERARALCEQLLATEVYPGFVVGWITPEGREVLAFGSAGGEAPRALDGRTLFEIGSLTKVFTGLLLADAVVRGEVRLEDPLSEHLPVDWSVPSFVGDGDPEAQPIRLWQLSTHTSGLPRLPAGILGGDALDPYRAFGPTDLRRALEKARLRSAPGQSYAYSNFGAGLLAYALGGDGPALDRRYRERLLGPLGLQDTGIQLSEDQQQRFAAAHGEGGRPTAPWNFDALAGAGALRSTVDDLLAFAAIELALAPLPVQANDGPTPPPPIPVTAALALALAREERWRAPEGSLAMGLGWHMNTLAGTRWHNGQTGGYHSFLALVPERRIGVVILANASAGQADDLGDRLLALLSGQAAPPFEFRAHVALPPGSLEPLVGDYSMGFLQKLHVTRHGDRLYAQLTGQDPLRLYPLSATRFFTRVVDSETEFVFDEDGRVTEAILHQDGRDTHANIPCRTPIVPLAHDRYRSNLRPAGWVGSNPRSSPVSQRRHIGLRVRARGSDQGSVGVDFHQGRSGMGEGPLQRGLQLVRVLDLDP